MDARFLLPCVLIGLVVPVGALAATNVTVVRQPSLLMFGDVNQSLGLVYTFNSHSNSGNSSSAQALRERYRFGTAVVLYDPSILLLDISAGASHQQDLSGSNSSAGVQYDILGSGMSTSSVPFTVVSSRSTSFIANGFTPSYSLTSTSTSLSAQLQHTILPLQAGYSHGTTSSDGLLVDYKSSTDSFSFGGSYRSDLGKTTFSLANSSESTEGRESRNYRFSLDNSLALDKARRYQLITLFTMEDSRPLDVANRTISFSESLSARLGKALFGALSYHYSENSSVGFNVDQEQTNNSVSGSLSHHLFASLSTSLSADYGDTKAFGGGSSAYGYTGAVNYRKQLPASSSLGLNLAYARRYTEQSILATRADIFDERHVVAQQGDFILPLRQGALSRVDTVRSLNPDTTYLENVDYRVDLALERIEIVVGGGIAPGTTLFISYTTALNPEITYRTDSYNAGFVLGYLGNRYQLSGTVATQSEQLLSGEASGDALNESTSYSLRGDANYGDLKWGGNYLYTDNSAQNYSKAGLHLTYNKTLSATDRAAVSVVDDYFIYPATDTGGGGYTQNTFSATASYSTYFWQQLRANAVVAGSDSRSRYSHGNTFMAKLSMGTNFRKLAVSLDATNLYRFSEGATAQDLTVVVGVVRSF